MTLTTKPVVVPAAELRRIEALAERPRRRDAARSWAAPAPASRRSRCGWTTAAARRSSGRSPRSAASCAPCPGSPASPRSRLPLGSLQAVLRSPREVKTYWVVSSSKDDGFIDRLISRLEDTLGAHGSQVTTQEVYVGRQDSVEANASLTRSITVLSLVIVAMSLVGLVNAITMGLLERTREIGRLRCVGARARDVRRIFGAEGLVVALIGWLLGLPAGWLMGRGLIALTASTADIESLHFAFPSVNLAITLVGTIVLALLVLLAPVRRAVRLKPGEALRYA